MHSWAQCSGSRALPAVCVGAEHDDMAALEVVPLVQLRVVGRRLLRLEVGHQPHSGAGQCDGGCWTGFDANLACDRQRVCLYVGTSGMCCASEWKYKHAACIPVCEALCSPRWKATSPLLTRSCHASPQPQSMQRIRVPGWQRSDLELGRSCSDDPTICLTLPCRAHEVSL